MIISLVFVMRCVDSRICSSSFRLVSNDFHVIPNCVPMMSYSFQLSSYSVHMNVLDSLTIARDVSMNSDDSPVSPVVVIRCMISLIVVL